MRSSVRIVPVQEAVAKLPLAGVYSYSGPQDLNVFIGALRERYEELKDVAMFQIHTEENPPYTGIPFNKAFRIIFQGKPSQLGL